MSGGNIAHTRNWKIVNLTLVNHLSWTVQFLSALFCQRSLVRSSLSGALSSGALLSGFPSSCLSFSTFPSNDCRFIRVHYRSTSPTIGRRHWFFAVSTRVLFKQTQMIHRRCLNGLCFALPITTANYSQCSLLCRPLRCVHRCCLNSLRFPALLHINLSVNSHSQFTTKAYQTQ